VGSILGLTQFRIKRLYAYSTISHVGFILLALSVHSVESIQAFFFYIIQYSLSNLNAFLILVLIGYTYINFNKKTMNYETGSSVYKVYKEKLSDLSPIQYIDNLKGYFYLNPVLAISLSITLYSFIGVPPLVGFFAKQMILSSALDNGDIFMCLIAILASVISAVYYLYIVKHMFFEKSNFSFNTSLKKLLKNSLTIIFNKHINISTDKNDNINSYIILSS
jgi:NADH-ubiquinone oxidoreductase chain 2